MKDIYTWTAILAIVFASVIGDVLLARAMKQVGDVGALWRRAGLGVVIGRTLRQSQFFLWRHGHGRGLLQPAVRALLGRREPGGSCRRFPHLHR